MIWRVIDRIRSDASDVTVLLSFGNNIAEFGFQALGREIRSYGKMIETTLIENHKALRLCPPKKDGALNAYWYDVYRSLVNELHPFRGMEISALPAETQAFAYGAMSFLALALNDGFRNQDIISIHLDKDGTLSIRRTSFSDMTGARRRSRILGNIEIKKQEREQHWQFIDELMARVAKRNVFGD